MNLIFLGPPGSGKGTQSSKLADLIGLDVIATGNILRDEIKNSSKLGVIAKSYVEKGDLVPDDLILNIIKNKVKNINSFLLDGFPRNINQAIELERMLSSIEKKIDCVVNFEVPDDILVKRILGRYVCKECKEVYNSFFKDTKQKNICDICGSNQLEKRIDDNEETLRNRMKVFHKSNNELCDFYKKNNLLISINAIENENFIFDKLKKLLKIN